MTPEARAELREIALTAPFKDDVWAGMDAPLGDTFITLIDALAVAEVEIAELAHILKMRTAQRDSALIERDRLIAALRSPGPESALDEIARLQAVVESWPARPWPTLPSSSRGEWDLEL